MNAALQMDAILFFLIVVGVAFGCDLDDVAVYKVKLHTLWSQETFPKDYPDYRPKAQWSKVFGQSHNSSYTLYRIGEEAAASVRQFSQYGKLDHLVELGDEEPRVYDQFSAPAIGAGVGSSENVVFIDGAHSLVSLICRIIPSPDWFVGVDSLDLCVNSNWVDQVTLDLEPLDAGAASGLTFTAPRWETSPPEQVFRHAPRTPDHPAAGFYYPNLRELPSIAKVEFTKVKEYSTKELNDLARKELLTKLREKDKNKGFADSNTLEEKPDSNKDEDSASNIETRTFVTKSPLDELMDLEENPVGTPKANIQENNVVVVTNSPNSQMPQDDNEFGSELKSMDDVVLAVAHGKKMGLGRHLPRHFRSRLHHAVNKIQPDDCLVSEWGEWTPCSATCGFGEKFRQRTVIRHRRGDGRECPSLSDRRHCGNVNSCTTMDYFEW